MSVYERNLLKSEIISSINFYTFVIDSIRVSGLHKK